jgi:DNA-binding MarR family transcriptional regulator
MDRTANLLGATALLLADAVLDGAGREAGRSGAGAAALAVLAQEPGSGIEQLRRPLGLSQSATVRVVNALETDGLAERGPGADGRSVSIRLTAAGRRRAKAVLGERAAVVEAAVGALSDDERRALTGILEKVLGALTTDRVHADRICRLCHYASCPEQVCPVELAGSAAGDPRAGADPA